MSLLKCSKCGELFSDSYKTCPFCAEDELYIEGGKTKGKNGGRRIDGGKAKGPSIIGPALVVVLVLLVAFFVYTFFGSQIGEWLHHDNKPGTEDVLPLTLDQTAAELKEGDELTLQVTGGKDVTFTSSDEKIITVDENGVVKAIAAGEATVTVLSDATDESAVCTVTVVAKQTTDPEPEQKPESEKKELELVSLYGTKDDIKILPDQPVPMMVKGTDSKVEWSVKDETVVTVSSDGTLTYAGTGSATITTLVAKVDGQTLTCTVRI